MQGAIKMKNSKRAMVYGPSTVFDRYGTPYPNAHWLQKGVQPVPNPDSSSKIKWVTKENAERIRNSMSKDSGIGSKVKSFVTDSVNEYMDSKLAGRMVKSFWNKSGESITNAGKAAFEKLKEKAVSAKEDFSNAIDKYISGDAAKAKRSDILSDLKTKGSNLVTSMKSVFVNLPSATVKTVQSAVNKAADIAASIASSNAGKEAIESGRTSFGFGNRSVLFTALESINNIFNSNI